MTATGAVKIRNGDNGSGDGYDGGGEDDSDGEITSGVMMVMKLWQRQ